MTSELPAGPALDALVAVQVMGWRRGQDLIEGITTRPQYVPPGGDEHAATPMVPSYSTSIAFAWEVVERMRKRGFTITTTIGRDLGPAMVRVEGLRHGYGMSQADTAPLAICRAALDAVQAPVAAR